MILPAGEAQALSRDRFTNGEFYGVFFNDYDANFYTGFAPRVQEKKNITIHVARGNQVRIRMVLTNAAISDALIYLYPPPNTTASSPFPVSERA